MKKYVFLWCIALLSIATSTQANTVNSRRQIACAYNRSDISFGSGYGNPINLADWGHAVSRAYAGQTYSCLSDYSQGDGQGHASWSVVYDHVWANGGNGYSGYYRWFYNGGQVVKRSFAHSPDRSFNYNNVRQNMFSRHVYTTN